METERLLNFSGEMGRQLLQNGAEIYRVEESMQRLLEAYGCPQSEIFAIPAMIVMNIQDGEKNNAKVLRVRTTRINLRRLHRLNALCRDLCRDTPPLDEAERRFREILEEQPYSEGRSYLAHGLSAFFFTLFWGGSAIDALVAFPCGLIVRWVTGFMGRVKANVFFTNVAASMLLAVLPLLLQTLGFGVAVDKVIIGTIMLLVPGLAITNSMRDVLSGDFITALSRFAEVIIVATGISIGIAMSITGGRAILGWLS